MAAFEQEDEGLPRCLIRLLGRTTYRTVGTPETNSGDECRVCMTSFGGDDTVCVLDCGHMFHRECLVPWVKAHSTCPLCRGFVLPVERVLNATFKEKDQDAVNAYLQRIMPDTVVETEEEDADDDDAQTIDVVLDSSFLPFLSSPSKPLGLPQTLEELYYK